jgi:hypothetical protein
MEYSIKRNGDICKDGDVVLTYSVETDSKIYVSRSDEVVAKIFKKRQGGAKIVLKRDQEDMTGRLEELYRKTLSAGPEPLRDLKTAAEGMLLLAKCMPLGGLLGSPSSPESYEDVSIENLMEHHGLNQEMAEGLFVFLVEEDDMSRNTALAKLDGQIHAGQTLPEIAEPYM